MLMRSKLFVPAARPELFAKALAGAADAISFDLEDSVAADGKAAARAQLNKFLRSNEARSGAAGKTLIVRVNPLNSPHFNEDLEAIGGLGIDLINLPKVEQAEEVRAAVAAIDWTDVGAGAAVPPGLLVNIETSRALVNATAIASAHPRVVGLQVGLNDLFEPLGIERSRLDHVHAALWAVRMASAAAGCFAYDGAYGGVADPDGFQREAELARSLGFTGKSCIHPSQVQIANIVFQQAESEFEAARRLVAAARTAAAQGKGAFLLDGRMIDRPAIAQAEAVLARAERPR